MPSENVVNAGETGRKLFDLAPEVMEYVIKQVSDKTDLSNARLACKALDRYATKEFFKDIMLSPTAEHLST